MYTFIFSLTLSQNTELKESLTQLETERDFYFAKLREIEVLCQENQDEAITKMIMDVMYATEVSSNNLALPARWSIHV